MKNLMRFFKDEDGVTAVEYGIMLALIAGVIIVAVTAIGTNLSSTFSTMATKVNLPAGT